MKTPLHHLKDEACEEAYNYFDKNVRPLPRRPDGKFNEMADGFVDNDVDAFRHAYVSGVFTQEYGEKVANGLGILNELPTYGYNSPNTAKSRNMDLWNNAVGRKYGMKTKSRKTLAADLLKALKREEMITDLKDLRNYKNFSRNITKKKMKLSHCPSGQHWVREHIRVYSSGHVATVIGHCRDNPLK
jgi:hypothetical protein